MKYITTSQVIRKIIQINPSARGKIELVKGEGYWYFVYDDIKTGEYETYSVMTFTLNQMDIGRWVGIGIDFIEAIKSGKNMHDLHL